MAILIHNFWKSIKNLSNSYSSLIKPLIFIFAIFLFSRTESTIANNSTYTLKNENLDSSSIISSTFINSHINEDEVNGTYYEQNGGSSWYHHKFHNRTTSNGERYRKDKLTAAHKKLPFGSIVKITNKLNGKTILVRINDRGPFHRKRIIDLSHKTAVELGALGNPKVKIETFIPDKSYRNDDIADEYFIAYSTFDKPQLLPEGEFEILNKYSDFDEAVESLDNDIFNRQLYLLVDVFQSRNDDGDNAYFVGYKKNSFFSSPKDYFLKLSAK